MRNETRMGGRLSPVAYALAALCALTVLMAACPPPKEPTPARTADHPLIRAVWHVETSSAKDYQAAIGAAGEHGPLQCSEAAWIDADMPDGTYADVERLEYAAAVFWRYTDRWCGSGATAEQRARCWNSGPRWRTEARQRATEGYWRKVRDALHAPPEPKK